MSEHKKYVEVITSLVRQPPYPNIPPKGATKVLPHLYLGNYEDAVDVPTLIAYNITHVVNTVEERHSCSTGQPFYEEAGIKYMGFSSDDVADYPILSRHFQCVYEFIEAARGCGGVCLLHCHAGVNRSGALCVAYVMLHLGVGPVTAVRLVLAARGSLLSNDSFIERIVEFAVDKGLLEVDEKPS